MMNEPMLESVMQRLSRLEWENRCWRLVGIAAVVMLGLVVLLGASGNKKANIAEEIQAKRFIVTDGDGKPRVVLGRNSLSETALVLLAKDGRIRAKLDLSFGDESPALAFYDKNDHRRAYLAVDDWGSESAQLQLIGKEESSRVDLSAWSSEESRPEFRGKAAVSLSNETVSAGLEVVSGMAELQFSQRQAGKMVTDTEKGTVELKLVHGTPKLILADRHIGYPGVLLGATDLANPRTGVEEKRPVSSILLLNKEGKVIWSAP